MLKKILTSEDGWGTIEYLIVFLSGAVLAGAALNLTLPSLTNLYKVMAGNFKDISGSGF